MGALPAGNASHALRRDSLRYSGGGRSLDGLAAWILLAGVALGYAIATIAHWFVEHNNPLIRISPVWGAVAALRMSWLALTGRLGEELAKHGIVDPRDVGANEGPADLTTRRTWMESEATRLELTQAERIIVASTNSITRRAILSTTMATDLTDMRC